MVKQFKLEKFAGTNACEWEIGAPYFFFAFG
jgi:hypothetical protein